MSMKAMHSRLDKLDARLPLAAPANARTIDLSRISKSEQKYLEKIIDQITTSDENGNKRQNLNILSVLELKTLLRIIQKTRTDFI